LVRGARVFVCVSQLTVAEGMLMIQNWSVYHVTLPYNCNYVVFWSTTFFLGGRVMRTLLGELLRDPSGMMGPDLVALLAVALAQIAGSGAYLARGMLDNHRLGRLLAFVLLPVCLWGCWRIVLRRLVSHKGWRCIVLV
jgi:hypothetical protein